MILIIDIYLLFLSFSLAGALSRYVQHKLQAEDLWKGPFGKVKEALRSGVSICERWTAACDSLTTQFWKRYGPHPWKGDKFVPENMTELHKRLEEVGKYMVLVLLKLKY